MKSFILILFFLAGSSFSYAQVKEGTTTAGQGSMKAEDLPEIVIKKASKDFSVYVPDKNPAAKVKRLQQEFVAYDLGKDYEGYENYLVVLELENASLAATYNSEGKLVSVVENYKDVRLPSKVIYSIYKAYPGWQIVKDKYLYTQEDGTVTNKHYNIKIKKGSETRKLTVDPEGNFITS